MFKSNSIGTKLALVAAICLLIGSGLGFATSSLGGYTKITETTTTSVGASTTISATVQEDVSADYAVDLEGCSINNKTCTYQVRDVTVPGSSLEATLGQGSPCVWLQYGPVNSASLDGASTCTVISGSALNNGGSATLVATFQAFGGVKAPTVGESLFGCIAEKWSNGTGCLFFLGAFTS